MSRAVFAKDLERALRRLRSNLKSGKLVDALPTNAQTEGFRAVYSTEWEASIVTPDAAYVVKTGFRYKLRKRIVLQSLTYASARRGFDAKNVYVVTVVFETSQEIADFIVRMTLYPEREESLLDDVAVDITQTVLGVVNETRSSTSSPVSEGALSNAHSLAEADSIWMRWC